MSKINDGGPAFAAMGVGPADDIYYEHGMSLRDYAAIHFMAGALSSATGIGDASPEERAIAFRAAANICLEAAAAFIEARSPDGGRDG